MDEGAQDNHKLREWKRQESSYTIWEKSPERPMYEYVYSDNEKQHRHHRRHHHRHHRPHRHEYSNRLDPGARTSSYASRMDMDHDSQRNHASKEDSGGIIGPLPSSSAADEHTYGAHLLPGEGKAMAEYVKKGKRIPRRGEIGLDSDKIEALERAGFVMSGTRHERMNVVRSRKENQVVTVEERAKELRQRAEDRARKEAEIIEQFREMAGVQHQSYAV